MSSSVKINNDWQLSRQDNIQLLRVGDLISEDTIKEILATIDACLAEGYVDYVVDLSSVDYINSVGLNLLIIIKERAKKKEGMVILAQASTTVIKLLKMTKLYPLFELSDTVEAAFDLFSAQKN